MYRYFIYFFVFFFQAEDGIRDGHVTGVQTCALPISPLLEDQGEWRGRRERAIHLDPPEAGRPLADPPRPHVERPEVKHVRRSEERRVGKEGRSGRAAEHDKKKERKVRKVV